MVKLVEAPTFIPLAETKIIEDGMTAFLEEMGVPEWKTDAKTDAERLIEVAGRLCYKSFAVGLNPNVTRVREGNRAYIANILQSGHGSVLEHGTLTFAILNTTPVVTHEIVRHRAGVSPSQVSGRYCRITDINFYMPDAFDRAFETGHVTPAELDQIKAEMMSMLERMETFQGRLARVFKMDKIADFTLKKALTSAFRRFAPYGVQTHIILTANHRAIRHMIAMRNDVHAEEEVRIFAHALGAFVKDRYPAIYQDMVLEHVEHLGAVEDVWRFKNAKV